MVMTADYGEDSPERGLEPRVDHSTDRFDPYLYAVDYITFSVSAVGVATGTWCGQVL